MCSFQVKMRLHLRTLLCLLAILLEALPQPRNTLRSLEIFLCEREISYLSYGKSKALECKNKVLS